MTQPVPDALRPPQWALVLLERTIPRDSLREAILGDLHEEYRSDALQVGQHLARMRCARRTVGIAAYALFDRLICRDWVSEGAPSNPAGEAAPPAPSVNPDVPVPVIGGAAAMHGIARYAIVSLFAFVVLLVGIVGNTLLFTAAEPQSVRVSSAAGVGGVVLFVACAACAAIIVCAGPRWRRRRLRGT